MVQKLRQRSQSESGFTLVELLVVMLILGLLAAIAVPSFFNQRDKARDADAKAGVRTAQTAIETYATDNGGAYTGATVAARDRGHAERRQPGSGPGRDREHLHGERHVHYRQRVQHQPKRHRSGHLHLYRDRRRRLPVER
jgi:prepilin-type N-terminal cleavage/methylation domain-containing protein